jgi:hypothetical protein
MLYRPSRACPWRLGASQSKFLTLYGVMKDIPPCLFCIVLTVAGAVLV